MNSDKPKAAVKFSYSWTKTIDWFSPSVILREGGVSRLDSRIRGNDDRKRGNAMIYILLALALLGALTMTMMRGNETGGDDLSKDEAELMATQMIAYAASAKQTVDQMIMSGTPVNSLNFILPSDPAFNTGSHIHKVFHPAGGGLTYKSADKKIFISTNPGISPGWYAGRFNNVEWTPTTAQDVLISAYGIHQSICEQINKKISGAATIPTFTRDFSRSFTVDPIHHGGTPQNLLGTDCPLCEGNPSFCAKALSGNFYVYYNIIVAR